MDDFIKTLRAQLYERVSSPLLSAFLISWCIWNWRIFLIWVGNADLAHKLQFVDDYFPDLLTSVMRGVVGPLSTTLLYIFAYPRVALPVYSFVQKSQAELERVRHQFEDEKPLPQKQAKELRQALFLAEQDFDVRISRKDSQIQALGIEADSLRKALDAAQSKTNAPEIDATGANPPLPFPDGAEKVIQSIIRPSEPSETSLSDYYESNLSDDLSNEAKMVVAVLFQQRDRSEATTIHDLYGYSSDLPKMQVQAALHQLNERGLIQQRGNNVSLTAAGMNAAFGIVKNPRL